MKNTSKPSYRVLATLAVLILLPSIARAQWAQAKGPYGGEVKGFAQDSAGTVFAAVYPGGVYYSADKGISWQSKNSSLFDSSITCIAVSGNTLFAGTSRGILISNDGGASWNRRDRDPLDFFTVNYIQVSGNSVYAEDAGGLYRSKDLGGTWTKIDSGLGSNSPRNLAMIGSALFVGVYQKGIYRSLDGGITWTGASTGLPISNNTVYALVAKGTELVASISDAGVYLSTDSAKTWSPMNSQLFRTVTLLAAKGDTVFAAADSGNIFMTGNDGEDWIRAYKTPYSAPPNALIAGNGFILAGRRGDGVFRSGDNGATWAVSNRGMTALRVADLVSTGGNLYAATNGNWVYRSNDVGESWTMMNVRAASGSGDWNVSFLGKSGGNLLASTPYGAVFSSDGGVTWKSVVSNYPSGFSSLASLGPYLFAGSGNGIFRSTDNGANWTRVKENKYGVDDAVILAMAADENTVYAKSTATFLVSRDSGATWTNLDFVLPKISGARPLAVCGNALFAASDPGIFRTTDHVTTWSPVNTGLQGSGPASRAPAISILSEYQGNLLALSYDGSLFLTRNLGDTWVKADSGLPVRNVSSLVADGEYLYAGSGSGVWLRKFPLTPVPTQTSRAPIPGTRLERLSVSAPGDGTLRIAYRIARPQRISIRILTLSGREAARPFEGIVAAGPHSLAWDGRALDAGCYHIVMRAGGRTFAERAILFR